MKKRLMLWLKKIWREIDKVTCPRCHKSVYREQTHREQTTVGVAILLCDNCHTELFKPFSKGLL